MLDIGWTELFVVGIVALIVIGPKDLPGALHTFGKYVGRARRVVRQFQDGIEDIARQEELRDLQKSVSDVTSGRSVNRYLDSDIDDTARPAKAQADADNSIAAPQSAPPEAIAADDTVAAGEPETAPTASKPKPTAAS